MPDLLPLFRSARCGRALPRLTLAPLIVASWIAPLSAAEPIQFNRDIRPILSEKCFACHGPDANHREAELRLDVESAAKAAAIVAGKPTESPLVSRITSRDPDAQMPPPKSGKTLSPEEVELLRRWISEGAAYQGHWAFLPPRTPALPQVENGGWVRSPIDRFVLARLEREGLQPAPEADRYELLRRVTLDLTGLPPTVAAAEAFAADTSANAYEKVVDRLLASDAYAEHMARYWLDAARYADTNGYQYDLEREQWVWRDWVIHAFKTNLPFDQFTIEQIAGDLLPDATDRQRLATGFHRNHPITIEGGVIDEEYRTEYVIDRVVTTSTTWLGLTMMCGRCHDHKYDPISQREFYQFFAFFNNVPERGLNGFAPKVKAASPLQSAEDERLAVELADATAEFQRQLALHEEPLRTWETQASAELLDRWQVVVPSRARSTGGATLTEQPDQSLLASGENPATDVYEFEIEVQRPVHAVRVEALTDPSLANRSTGRASNGNFVLSEVTLEAASQDAASQDAASQDDQWQPLKFRSAEADYSQANYPVGHAIDGKVDRGGWAVDGNTKPESRAAWFQLDRPVMPQEKNATRLRLRLHFAWGGSHQIGRVRLALAARPLAQADPALAALLARPAAQRTAEQTAQLKELLAGRFAAGEFRAAVERLRRVREQQAALKQTPETMVLAEMDAPRAAHVLARGEYDKPGERVEPGTPAALPPMPADFPRNRLGLARWLVMPEHPLTARVAVNRYWQQLFGRGIVASVEDFGSQGSWPSHPELLDWLATRFAGQRWDIRALLKEIVMSAAYRQSSRVAPSRAEADPENVLLARGPRLRLDAEVIRDSALFASGLLSDRLGGPSVFPYHPAGLWQEINNRPGYSRTYQRDAGEKLYRRSMYTFWKRTVPPPSMAAFDAPEREFCIVRRSRTNTPLQAFVLLHDPQFVEAGRKLAERVLLEDGLDTDAQKLTYAFQLCCCRPPTVREQQVLTELLQSRRELYRRDADAAAKLLAVGESPRDPALDQAELAAWATVARALMNLSEFVTKP